jgi:hypothetical protein
MRRINNARSAAVTRWFYGVAMVLTSACGEDAVDQKSSEQISWGGASASAAGTPAAGGGPASAGLQSSMGGSGGLDKTAHQGGTGAAGGSTSGSTVSDAGHSGAAGDAGTTGKAGAAGGVDGKAGDASPGDNDITSVCKGGKVGTDSETANTPGLTVSREYGAVKYLAVSGIEILTLKTTMKVPKTPSQRQTLFIWPALQNRGASDPGRIGNGILQPVLTWGPSCNPKLPSSNEYYDKWWIAGMYVNVSSLAAGPTGCAGGDYMLTEAGDLLEMEISVKGTEWTQTIVNKRNKETVDFTIDLKGQVQNWATWAVEVPDGETIAPVDDTIFTKSVLTFSAPVTTCQPSQAGAEDYFSAPVLSPNGLHCCYDTINLRKR